MHGARCIIENEHGLLAIYKAVSNLGFSRHSFVSSRDDYCSELAAIEAEREKISAIYDIIKKRFHMSGFIALLGANDAQAGEIELFAINVGLKSAAALDSSVLEPMRQLLKRVDGSDAIKNRASTFVALQNVFRSCKKIALDGDLYKMVAIALAQFMLTNPCFTASRYTPDASIPKTWKLLLMEARVFIGSLKSTDDRKRVLEVFQQAIKAQEERFIEAVKKHPSVLKIQDAQKRQQKIERFEATLADCNKLFSPAVPEASVSSPAQITNCSFFDEAEEPRESLLRDSLVTGYAEAHFDLKKFGKAKGELSELLARVESAKGKLTSDFLLQLVEGYLRYDFVVEPQSMSQSIFSYARLNAFFGGVIRFASAHPSMVWVQLITYARLLAEQCDDSRGCLAALYEKVDEMAEHKGWGQVKEHFSYLSRDVQAKPALT